MRVKNEVKIPPTPQGYLKIKTLQSKGTKPEIISTLVPFF